VVFVDDHKGKYQQARLLGIRPDDLVSVRDAHGRDKDVATALVYVEGGEGLVRLAECRVDTLPDGSVRVEPPTTATAPAKKRRRGHPAAAAGDDRPQIEVTTERHLVHEETVKVLAREGNLYRRGDVLGLVIEEAEDVARLPGGIELLKARGMVRLVPLSHAALGCLLTRHAAFYKRSLDRNGEPVSRPAHPPNWLISAVAEIPLWPGVRELRTIAECPAIRADGGLTEPGFDAETGTLFRYPAAIRGIPARPTRQDAEAAARRLHRLVEQFPFDDEVSWSAWLAALLTAIQRPLIAGPVPGFVITANKAGTGKGLLVDLVGIIAWGRVIPTRSYPRDPAEAEKVKVTLAITAVSVVHFDNVDEGGSYGGGAIDSALTSFTVDGRLLGQNRDAGDVPLRPCWFVTGNNLTPYKDAYRRWVPDILRTDLEAPHERRDIKIKDLRGHALEERPKLLRDALIILRAHALAGRPTGGWGPLGSYELWDPIVRGAVWFVTAKDCVENQRKLTAESPELAEDLPLLKCWYDADPNGQGMTIKAAIARSEDTPVLREALDAYRDMFGNLPPASIAYKFRGLKNKTIDGYRLVECGENHFHDMVWRVIKTS
jgi:putative DNA primase/helicase